MDNKSPTLRRYPSPQRTSIDAYPPLIIPVSHGDMNLYRPPLSAEESRIFNSFIVDITEDSGKEDDQDSEEGCGIEILLPMGRSSEDIDSRSSTAFVANDLQTFGTLLDTTSSMGMSRKTDMEDSHDYSPPVEYFEGCN